MALMRIGHTGVKRAVQLDVIKPVQRTAKLPGGVEYLHLWCGLKSGVGAKGIPIWIRLSHDEAMKLCAELANKLRKSPARMEEKESTQS